jgi:hypothetical protein
VSWRPGYAVAAAALLAIEIVIAVAVHDAFVRPYLGDSLAVILVYLSLRAATRLGVLPAAAAAFATGVVIEFGQLANVTDLLGLHESVVARTVLGTGYDPRDFIAYAGGALAALSAERLRLRVAKSM